MAAPEPLPKALLFVLASPGPKVTEGEFNDWYDNDHAPSRVALPEFLTGARYVQADSKTPEWLAAYEIENTNVLTSPSYTKLWENSSSLEKDILKRIGMLERRVYEHISTKEAAEGHDDGVGSKNAKGKMLVAIGMEPTGDLTDEEFNRWYDEQQIPAVLKAPQLRRVSRWRLKNGPERSSNSQGGGVPAYLALYEVEDERFLTSNADQAATSTEWGKRVVSNINLKSEETRVFTLYRSLK